MTMWLAILLVGLGTYTFRVVPLLLTEWVRLSDRADAVLRHASAGAMTALLVTGVRGLGDGSGGHSLVAGVLAVGVASGLALLGRSLPLVVLSGAVTYAASAPALATLMA